ncbi:TetR/AcrR family transcriptional regulator [Nioella nitratireducens]|uniref:TetR/AcrR family transcriptional regulator n=1 Tax=Nioella nitratireducens TaxID=1287720 RepID=UPI0008FD6774|nr:TetR/AcrR family transcriptional regulator [Nioella nitratireducens]
MTIQKPDKTHGWRGSADLWIDAAYEVLIDGGVEAVKVMPLAKALGLSRTSFYWHFTDREALLAAIIDRWEAKNTGNLVARCTAPAGSICAAIFNLFDCWIDEDLFDSRLDLAIRNWALTDAGLRARVNAADATRLAAMRDMFDRHGQDGRLAMIRAHTMIFTQVGYYTMQLGESITERLDRMPLYVEAFTGQAPSKAEIAEFYARHGHDA